MTTKDNDERERDKTTCFKVLNQANWSVQVSNDTGPVQTPDKVFVTATTPTRMLECHIYTAGMILFLSSYMAI